jgi:predicted Zn-dependent protease
MKRTAFALIALLCLCVFTLPTVAEAKSPPGAAQVSQDYQVNITDSTAGIAGYQHNIIVNDGSEVDIGACADASTGVPFDFTLTATNRHTSAFGRVATNESVHSTDSMAINYNGTAHTATAYHARK